MKTFLVFSVYVLCVFALLSPLAIFIGCMTDGSSAISTINATVTHNSESGDWSGGLTFTFKDLPSESELRTMERFKAVRVNEKVFVLPAKEKLSMKSTTNKQMGIKIEELPASGYEGKGEYYLRHRHIIIHSEYEPVVVKTNGAWTISFNLKQ